MKFYKGLIFLSLALLFMLATGCQGQENYLNDMSANHSAATSTAGMRATDYLFYQGADLSYVNELEDNGVKYHKDGSDVDPFTLLRSYGANIVRLRLWHNPSWTSYSTLNDVERSMKRAKTVGLEVLLDFHYSDTWTDPQQNLVPAAWKPVVKNSSLLSDSVYNYTYRTLEHLNSVGLLPVIVQIGNETNFNVIVADNNDLQPVNYARNVKFFNAGLKAVSDFNEQYGKQIKTMLHVALDPGSAATWLVRHKRYGLNYFDLLGLSYYPQWQDYTPTELGNFASLLHDKYGTRLFVAETSQIWTRAWNDNNHNLMSKMCAGYPDVPSPQFQKDYVTEIKEALMNNGGAGFSVWEPFWVSASNKTLWGIGSNWENATFFDFNNNLLPHSAIEAYGDYNVKVTFEVDMYKVGSSAKGYVTGDFTDDGFGHWQIIPMHQAAEGSTKYYLNTYLCRNQTGKFYFLSDSTWSSREVINGSVQDRCYHINTADNWMKIAKDFGKQ